MQLIQGSSIFSADGKPIGRIDRVVIDPRTMAVTHLVVHTGILFGQNKVVPLDLIGVGEQDRPVLRLCASQLAQMPDFGMVHYRTTTGEELPRDAECAPLLPPPVCWYPLYPSASVGLYTRQSNMRGARVNIPAGTVAVKEGAKVVSADGKHLGRIERVLTSPPTEQATYFQVSKGWQLKQRKLVPFEWVHRMDEDQVRLMVGARTIQDLPE